jgi:ElaB/YqjD/DUF883 family membrane-anchored ribosome-binding protein
MESGRKTPEPDEIQREIEETREELGETVEALAEKADVKKQVKRKAAETQESVKTKAAQAQEKVGEVVPDQARQAAAQAAQGVRGRTAPVIAVAALVGGLLLWALARR